MPATLDGLAGDVDAQAAPPMVPGAAPASRVSIVGAQCVAGHLDPVGVAAAPRSTRADRGPADRGRRARLPPAALGTLAPGPEMAEASSRAHTLGSAERVDDRKRRSDTWQRTRSDRDGSLRDRTTRCRSTTHRDRTTRATGPCGRSRPRRVRVSSIPCRTSPLHVERARNYLERQTPDLAPCVVRAAFGRWTNSG